MNPMRRSVVGTVAVSIAVALTANPASAATKISWVGPTPPGEGGQIYLTTSTINNSPLEASSRIYTSFGTSVPSGYMGVQARLFKSGVLCQMTDYVYNAGTTNQQTTNTWGHCGSGSYNSHGFVKYWTGDGYGDFLTFPTDPLSYAAPSGRASAAPTKVTSTRNSRGQTLGTADNARSDEELPDLVAAFDSTGQQGYIRKADLTGTDPVSPAAALRKRSRSGTSVAVFTADGTTRIGALKVN